MFNQRPWQLLQAGACDAVFSKMSHNEVVAATGERMIQGEGEAGSNQDAHRPQVTGELAC